MMTPTESAYRRGVHQALDAATDMLDDVSSIKAGRRRLAKAAAIARTLREDRPRGYPCLLDEIRSRLHRPTTLRRCTECGCPEHFEPNAPPVCDTCDYERTAATTPTNAIDLAQSPF